MGDEVEPQVIVDFEFEGGLLFVAVRNVSTRAALKVSTTFDKPFRGLGGVREMNGLRLFRNIEFLAPGKEIRTLLDTSAAYFARREPTKLTATVSYRLFGERRRQEHVIAHDLAVYRELAYTPEGATDA